METKTESPVRTGYSIILREDGTLEFDILGPHVGLIELLGIHEYAKLEITARVDGTRYSGDYRVHEVGKAVSILNQKVDQLLQLLPKAEIIP